MGCGESRQSRQDTQQGIPASVSEETGQDSTLEKAVADETEIAAQTSERYEDNFAVDSKSAKEFGF